MTFFEELGSLKTTEKHLNLPLYKSIIFKIAHFGHMVIKLTQSF